MGKRKNPTDRGLRFHKLAMEAVRIGNELLELVPDIDAPAKAPRRQRLQEILRELDEG